MKASENWDYLMESHLPAADRPVAMSQPYVTRGADGRVEVTWPDPVAAEYPMSSEIIRLFAESVNRTVDLAEALVSLLDYTDRHRVSVPMVHDHDCYELWSIEKEHVRRLLAEAGNPFGFVPEDKP
jgi:hypothetical protein